MGVFCGHHCGATNPKRIFQMFPFPTRSLHPHQRMELLYCHSCILTTNSSACCHRLASFPVNHYCSSCIRRISLTGGARNVTSPPNSDANPSDEFGPRRISWLILDNYTHDTNSLNVPNSRSLCPLLHVKTLQARYRHLTLTKVKQTALTLLALQPLAVSIKGATSVVFLFEARLTYCNCLDVLFIQRFADATTYW